MDLDDFRSILETAGVDVWMFIDTAITVASMDYAGDLKRRRDGIVEKLYAATVAPPLCRNCEGGSNIKPNGKQIKKQSSPSPSPIRQQRRREASPATPQSLGNDDDEEELDPYGGLFDDEQNKVLEIKEQLEDPHQSEDSLVDLLQNLADMDITFQALKETDIGRHVNRLRKHPSNDVRRLVKLLVRKWKEIVDEWVRLNPQGGTNNTLMADGDSPPQKTTPNGHHHSQIPDFAYSPNPHNGSSGSDRNTEVEPKPKPKPIPRREAPPKPSPVTPAPTSQNRQREQREQKESNFDAERLASARKRLQENYKEAENAKKQRTIQVMDIHDLPKSKPKNGFFPKNKGGGGSQTRHW